MLGESNQKPYSIKLIKRSPNPDKNCNRNYQRFRTAFIPGKVTSRTHDCARLPRSVRDLEDRETGINQQKYTIKLIYTCVTARFSWAVGLPSFSLKPVVGLLNWNKPNWRINSWRTCGVWWIREPEYTCS